MGRYEGAFVPLGRKAGDDEGEDRAAEPGDDEPGGLLAPRGPGEGVALLRDEVEAEHREGHEEEKRLAEQGPDHRSERLIAIGPPGRPHASRFIEPDIEIAKDACRDPPDVTLSERNGIILPDRAAPLAGVELVVRGIEQEGERHLEGLRDLVGVERQAEARPYEPDDR